jgi:hypothetical protein
LVEGLEGWREPEGLEEWREPEGLEEWREPEGLLEERWEGGWVEVWYWLSSMAVVTALEMIGWRWVRDR